MTSRNPGFSAGRATVLALTLSLLVVVLIGNRDAAGRSRPAGDSDRSVVYADQGPTVLTNTAYLPILSNGFPFQTPFGFETFEVVPGGGWPEMTAAKASWVRRDGLLWSDVEPSPGVRDWSTEAPLEQEMLNAASSGMQMILVVRQAPPWARVTSTNTCSAIAPSQLGAFAAFMRDVVARYSVQPYGIHHWEIWNEPDVDPSILPGGPSNVTSAFGCWGNDSDPYYGGGAFAAMLQAIYPQMKAADPSAEVMVGGLLLDCAPGFVCNSGPRADKFLEGILKAGGAPYFDAVAFHAYEWHALGNLGLGQYSSPNWPSSWNTTGPLLIAKAQFIRQLLSQYGVTGKRLFSTETAVLCGNGCPDDNTFEMTKAYYVTQSFAAAMAQGLESSSWYNYFGWYGSGLASSSSPWGPLPAYTAYEVARSQLGDAQFASTVTTYPSVQAYAFTRRGHPLWVLWSLDGAAHPISLPSAATAALDAMGNPVTVSGNAVTVTITPIFVQLP